MGIDFENSKAHWSYSGFDDFLYKLAKLDGIDNLYETEYKNKNGKKIISILRPLYLVRTQHKFSPLELKIIFPRFEALMIKMLKEYGSEDYNVFNGYELMDTMLACIKNNQPLNLY